MEFRETEPDYENILNAAGWRVYVERKPHCMKEALFDA